MMPAPQTWATSITAERPLIGLRSNIPTRTFTDALQEVAETHGNRVQYVTAEGREVTLSEFYGLSRSVAKSCMALGMGRGDGVGILGFNAVQWFAADVGVTLAGAVPAGIYTTNRNEIVAYILKHSKSKVLFVDNEEMLKKGLACRKDATGVQMIVVWGSFDLAPYAAEGDYVQTWDQFLSIGKNVSDAELNERMAQAKPEHVAKLIYTSGTTGPPKAVMISHDNITFTLNTVLTLITCTEKDEMVSYLPCSHVAANLLDVSAAVLVGQRVTLARPDALRGSLVQTLKAVRPTIFLAVPRVFEKIQEKLLQVGAASGPVKTAISKWAKSVGTRASFARDASDDLMPWGYKLANLVVFKNIRNALGLDRCRLIVNAAAPLQRATKDYFRSLDFQLHDIYGMSEATGPLTFTYPNYRTGSCGKPLPGVEVMLRNVDETGEGELCWRGRNVFVGYLGDEEETKKAMDADGYLHSGDLGRVDEDGYVYITGRAKELIVTAGGENVAPALVETSLMSAMSAISRAFPVGDQRKYVSCLLVPHMDEQGQLIGPALKVNNAVRTAEQAAHDAEWQAYIEEGIAKANEEAVSNAAKVRKYKLLSKDFTIDDGELTPTMKVKRKIVGSNYADVIESMYA